MYIVTPSNISMEQTTIIIYDDEFGHYFDGFGAESRFINNTKFLATKLLIDTAKFRMH